MGDNDHDDNDEDDDDDDERIGWEESSLLHSITLLTHLHTSIICSNIIAEIEKNIKQINKLGFYS